MRIPVLLLFIFLLGLSVPKTSFAKTKAPKKLTESLHSFAKNLDKTLRSVDGRSTLPCAPESVRFPSAEKTTYENKEVSSLTEKDVQALFADMQSQSEIPFGFALDGCLDRAHEMSRLMYLRGITPLKAQVYPEIDMDPSKENVLLQVPHPQREGETIQWSSHIAPLVMVKKNGKTEPYIIDPSIFKKAVPLKEWRAYLTAHDKKMKVSTEILEGTVYSSLGSEVSADDVQRNLRKFKNYQDDMFGEEKYWEDRNSEPSE